MTTKTRAQLVTEAAECLQLIAAGQPLEDDDEDVIDGLVDVLVEQLAADNVVEIEDLTEIPAKYFKALGELLANACATKFGMPYDPNKKQVFEAQLKKTASASPTYETLKAVYY